MKTETKLVACEWCGNGIPLAVFISSKKYYSRGLCGKCQDNANPNSCFNRNGSISIPPGKEIESSYGE